MIKHNEEDFENDYDNYSDESYEQENDDSERGSQQRNGFKETTEFFQIHGMFFCSTCKNLMEPTKTKAEILEFKCRRCGPKPINFTDRKQNKCLIISKSLQASAPQTDLESKSIFDKSMPIMCVECPDCSYDEAVYTVVPEEGERRIVIKLICARGAEDGIVKCGNKWDLMQESEIDETDVDGALQLKEEGLIEQED